MCIFLLPKRFNITYSAGLLVWLILLTFVCLKESLFWPCFWKICSLDREFKIDKVFSFSVLKMLCHWSSYLHCSQQESCCHPYLCSSIHNVSKFLWLFLWFSLYHWFWAIVLWCALVSFFVFSWFLCFGFMELLGAVNLLFLSNLGNLGLLFLQKFFLSSPFFSHMDSSYMCNRLLEVIPESTGALFFY